MLTDDVKIWNIIKTSFECQHKTFLVTVTKLHVSWSQQSRALLQHEKWVPGERRQLKTRTVVKFAILCVDLQPRGKGSETLPRP